MPLLQRPSLPPAHVSVAALPDGGALAAYDLDGAGKRAVAAALNLYQRAQDTPAGRFGLRLGIAFVVVAPGLWIGCFEGGYNHLVKDLVYLAGTAPETIHRFFPAPRYEPPNDAFFEATGMLQLPLGIWAIIAAGRLARTGPRHSTE